MRIMLTVYQDLATPSRRAILAALLDGPKNVSEVVAITGQKQPNVSNHLAKMRRSKTVRASRIGRAIYYGFASADIQEAVRTAVDSPPRVAASCDCCEQARSFASFAIRGDEVACAEIVDRLTRSGATLIEVFEGLLGNAMTLVGDLYAQGEIDEANEHAASAIAERLLARISACQVPKRPNGRTAVVGCVANNWHSIGARMLADYLRSEGWRVNYLGPNVPIAAFLRTVSEGGPDVALVSVSTASIQDATALLGKLRAANPELPIAVGGSGLSVSPERFASLGVDTPGPTFASLAQWLEAKAAPPAS